MRRCREPIPTSEDPINTTKSSYKLCQGGNEETNSDLLMVIYPVSATLRDSPRSVVIPMMCLGTIVSPSRPSLGDSHRRAAVSAEEAA
jgi:hypothetical protein